VNVSLPRYSVLGILIMALSEIGMLLQVEPFWSWHTPIAWTGYILFVDGFVWARGGSSWLTAARREFVFLALVSIPLWLVFEFYNLFIRNWHYVNLPEVAALRYFGYAWAFATIWPAIFQTGEAVARLRSGPPEGGPHGRERIVPADPLRIPLGGAGLVSVAAGLAMLVWPLAWPSPYLAAPVWLGFIFLLDPLNAAAGAESIRGDLRRGRADRLINLCVAGLVCGVLWEFWNYWARAKWIYTVPIMAEVRLFEMPLPGYLGFPAFALECFTMYVSVRLLVRRGRGRTISL
jgi:hypothetical protein